MKFERKQIDDKFVQEHIHNSYDLHNYTEDQDTRLVSINHSTVVEYTKYKCSHTSSHKGQLTSKLNSKTVPVLPSLEGTTTVIDVVTR